MTRGPRHFPALGRPGRFPPQRKTFKAFLVRLGETFSSQRLFIAHPGGNCGVKPRNHRHFTFIRPCLQKLDMPSRHPLPFHALSLTPYPAGNTPKSNVPRS